MSRPLVPIVSCEHGGNRVPARYRELFAAQEELLESHRGHDPGSLALARALSRRLDAPLIASRTTRLLVELNRSPRHPRLFSEFTRGLPPAEKERILARHYRPYREAVEAAVGTAVTARSRALHLSVHTFTPVLDGVVRPTDVGLLYDPARRSESAFCRRLAAALRAALPGLAIHRNRPYRGAADGLTRHLRRRFADGDYVGIEIEVNQKYARSRREEWRRIAEALAIELAERVGAPSPVAGGKAAVES